MISAICFIIAVFAFGFGILLGWNGEMTVGVVRCLFIGLTATALGLLLGGFPWGVTFGKAA